MRSTWAFVARGVRRWDRMLVWPRKARRYPDALVTCSPQDGTARTVAGAVVVFEIVSPSSGGVDRIIKVREYAGVASLRYHVIIESTSVGLLVLHRHSGAHAWTAET